MDDDNVDTTQDETTKQRQFSDDQERRIAALKEARGVLSNSAMFAVSSIPEHRTIGDLIVLAEWILEGPSSEDEETLEDLS